MIRLRTRGARAGADLRPVLACMLVLGLAPAAAQEPPRPQTEAPAAVPAPAPQPPPPPAADGGPFAAIGRAIDQSIVDLGLGFKGARERVDDVAGRAGNAAKDAAGAVKGLRKPGVVAGRELCLPAPNGAPNCVAATLVMCRANGFANGSSIDIQTEEICPTPPPSLTTQRPPDENDCRLESYVTRALCR
jgi:hypothetical protein